MKYIFFLLFLLLHVGAKEFSVASYNVENLFDLEYDGSEYKEYIPNSKSKWNRLSFNKKIENISRVLKDLDADILSLQEIENKNALFFLNKALEDKKYPYTFISKDRSNIKTVLLSRYKIADSKCLHVESFSRPICKVKIQVEDKEVSIFLNHWPSYKNGIKSRQKYTDKLQEFYKEEKEYILLGDFNAPFQKQKNEWGKSLESLHVSNYNLWYELPYKQRYSHSFFKSKKALDHIILSKSMFDKRGIDYKPNSFRVFKPRYLVDKYQNPIRWQISKKGKGEHQAEGYSDHLPIIATFQTDNYSYEKPKPMSIKKLLNVKDGRVDIELKDVHVKSITKHGVYISDNSKADIFVYKPDIKLEKNRVYNLHVKQIVTYKGKKEISLIKYFEYFISRF